MRRVWHKGAAGSQVTGPDGNPYAPCGDVPAPGTAALLVAASASATTDADSTLAGAGPVA